MLPESMEILSTIPGRSVETVTQWTATAVPIASRLTGPSSRFVTIVVTASGGGWNEACCAIDFLTCLYFTAPMAETKTAITTSIRNMRFFMNRYLHWLPLPVGRVEGPRS